MRYLLLLIPTALLCGCDGYRPEPTPAASKWKELSPHLKKSDGQAWGGLWVYDDVERGYIVYSTDDGIVAVPMHLPAEK